jgi:hypothetical protein
MKTALCGIALVCSSAAFAQTSPVPVAASPKTITLTGCVGGGTNAQPITLANAMVIPSTEQAGAPAVPPSPVPDVVSRPATQPPTAAGTSDAAATANTAATGGTSGTAAATGSATVGTAAGSPSPTSGAIGTSGAITGTAPAGSSASSISGYRLSGADMTSWVGRRVQIVGIVVPAASGAMTLSAGAAGYGPDGSPIVPEFRVISVQPVTGSCPEQ